MSDLTSKTRVPRKPKKYTAKTLDTRTHSFNVGIATDYSPNMALWIGHLAFWTEKNFAHEKHIHDGLVWCFDTLDAICEYFPYFTRRQIETIINNSIQEGLVKRGNYNHTEYDRTCWYALTPKAYVYFPHFLTEKNLKRLFASISQICEMDFTEMCNGFPRSVTTIPDTDPDTDPDDCVGASPDSTTHKFPSKKEIQSKAAFDNMDARDFFNAKFQNYEVTYEQIFDDCKNHYDEKNQWTTVKKWMSWLEREKIDNYSKNSDKIKTPPKDETDDQRRERQFFTYELIKEKENNSYVSQALKDLPEMREKYARYA